MDFQKEGLEILLSIRASKSRSPCNIAFSTVREELDSCWVKGDGFWVTVEEFVLFSLLMVSFFSFLDEYFPLQD